MKKLITTLIILLSISGCASQKNSIQTYQTPRFLNEAPIKLNVKEIEVISEFSPSFMRPNVEHLLPVSIEKTARTWAEDRLEATNINSDKKAYVTIKNASVTEELLDSQKFLEKDQLKYSAKLYVELKIVDENNLSSAQTEIQAWRELSIPSDTPLFQKELYWGSMVEKLFNTFNAQMTDNINTYLGQYVVK